ncbi:uncharacterized protein BDZ99DRAFT_353451, partial [Mytilinidion resinicola]
TSTVPPSTTHLVQVGGQGNLIFSPTYISAPVGDVIHFKFLKLNHTLSQSSLEDPCTPNNVFDTGFIHFNPQNRTDYALDFLIQNSNPQWFFCRQEIPLSHCHAGMVFAINPGSNMDEFLVNA